MHHGAITNGPDYILHLPFCVSAIAQIFIKQMRHDHNKGVDYARLINRPVF